MNPVFYSVLHVLAAFVLVGYTFAAFAAPAPEKRGRVMMMTGIAALVMLVSGMGLQAKMHVGWPAWLLVKMVCWLALATLSGIAFRSPSAAGKYSLFALVLIAVAVYCVYVKPF